tara:strand:+ start:6903 stop:7841 length:939 start_codon:yes stop_codon:yes gene_type:complete
MDIELDHLFGPRLEFPDFDAAERLEQLVGLDEHQIALAKFLGVAINPGGLKQWIDKHHGGADAMLSSLLRRPPLAVLAGDVGSGKTVLAETIGDKIARTEGIKLILYPLSLSTRGQGRVGEMTHLLSEAFNHIYLEARKRRRDDGKPGAGVLMLIDEADALAQSREESQMHHEDRAGVNAFIRGIDRLAEPNLPAAAIMCTNRPSALDPAIRRRAGELLTFSRPDDEQRRALLEPLLANVGLKASTITDVINATGARSGRDYGCTYSDLVQRLIPEIALRAYPDRAISADDAVAVATDLAPTPPFTDRGTEM